MKILPRYILGELLLNAAFTFVVLATLITMLQLSIAALQASKAGLSLPSLLTVVAMISAGQLEIVLPMSVLVACLGTYGRLQAEGELTAMRGAGVGLMTLVQPALVLGAATTLVLAVIGDELVPDAHLRQKEITKQEFARNIDALLRDGGNRIQDERFRCEWKSTEVDEEGFLVLLDFVVYDGKHDDRPPVFTRARSAIPRYDEASGRLTITLRDFAHGTNVASGEMTLELDLRTLTETVPGRRGIDNFYYDELILASRRGSDARNMRIAAAELQQRAASSFSAFAFAALGAMLGVALRLSNRVLVFVTGFLMALLLGFAPTLLGLRLARSGALPAGAALWIGDAVVLALAGVAARKAWKA